MGWMRNYRQTAPSYSTGNVWVTVIPWPQPCYVSVHGNSIWQTCSVAISTSPCWSWLGINTCHVQTEFYCYRFLESSFYTPWHCWNHQKGLLFLSTPISVLHSVSFITLLLKQIFVFLAKDIFLKNIILYFLTFIQKNS